MGYGESGGDTMAQNTPHDGKHYFPVWNRYAIRKYYTASSARMSTPRTALGGISVGGGGDRFAEHKTPHASPRRNTDMQ